MTEAEKKASGVWTEWAREQLVKEYPAAKDCLIIFRDRRVRLLDAGGVERGVWRTDREFVPGLVSALASLGKPPPKRGAADVVTDILWSIMEAVFSVPDIIAGAIKKLFSRR